MICDVIDWLQPLTDIEGVTFSGGEPLQQASSLFLLINEIKRVRPDLSLGLFTGYSFKELEEGRFRYRRNDNAAWQNGTSKLWLEIKKHLDFAVTGRFNQLVPTKDDAMRGSKNQEIHYFTDRYKQADMPEQAVEVLIEEDGLVKITGFPNEAFRKAFPVDGEFEHSAPAATSKDGDDPELACA